MASSIDWPATLPTFQEALYRDYGEDWPYPIKRTEVNAGPPLRRRLFSAGSDVVTITLPITGDQKDTLRTFYLETLRHGLESFNATHPDDSGQAIEVALIGPPALTFEGGGDWLVTLSLEVLP